MMDSTTSTAKLRDTANTSRKRGRPAVGEVAMTPAERKRLQRERQKHEASPERVKAATGRLEAAIREAQSVLATLRSHCSALAEATEEPAPESAQVALHPGPEQAATEPDWRHSEVARALGELVGVASDEWDEQDLEYWREPLEAGEPELTVAEVGQIRRYAEADPGALFTQYWHNLSHRRELVREAQEWEAKQ